MEHTWRWFGPDDPVSLDDVRQAGAAGVVTALHHLPNGVVWSREAIRERKRWIEEAPAGRSPLRWSVVESVPVHEAIRRGAPDRDRHIDAYAETLQNLGACGVRTVCYNFMPVVDWTRTDLDYELPTGARALRLDRTDLAAFDLFGLARPGAPSDYDPALLAAAESRWAALDDDARVRLERTILAGLPGAEEAYTLDDFRAALDAYDGIGPDELREHLVYFLRAVVPAARAAGVRLALHPDDPPYGLFGLPRVVSTEDDVARLLAAVDDPANGLTFCTGSFGVRRDNDLPGMVRRLGPRIHFVHLRATRRAPDGSFHEADHLDGDVDMYAVVRALAEEERRRTHEGREDAVLPMRPDHGHRLLDDLRRRTNPGYSAIGRLRGLAELRGLELAVRRALDEP